MSEVIKFINMNELRNLHNEYSKGELSASRVLEILNKKAYDFYKNK